MMQLNKPSPRLAILRAELAAKADAEQLQRDTMRLMSLAPIRCKAPAPDADSLPLPPSYWDDLEHWLKTLAPAKPAEPQSCQAPADPGVAKLTHSVCLRAHEATHWIHWCTGEVKKGSPDQMHFSQHWLPCEKDGWIPHTPTADSKCPVPDGVKFEYILRGGGNNLYDDERDEVYWRMLTDGRTHHQDIVAWRPIAGGGK